MPRAPHLVAREPRLELDDDLGTRDATIVLSVMALLVALIVAFLALPGARPTAPEAVPGTFSAESPTPEEFDHASRH